MRVGHSLRCRNSAKENQMKVASSFNSGVPLEDDFTHLKSFNSFTLGGNFLDDLKQIKNANSFVKEPNANDYFAAERVYTLDSENDYENVERTDIEKDSSTLSLSEANDGVGKMKAQMHSSSSHGLLPINDLGHSSLIEEERARVHKRTLARLKTKRASSKDAKTTTMQL